MSAGRIGVAAACDKLEGQVEALVAVSVEGDTAKLDEYLSGKSEVVEECKHGHWLCFASCNVGVAETPVGPLLGEGVTGCSQAIGGTANREVVAQPLQP